MTKNYDISLIESKNISTVGVGESTIAQITDWLRLLKIEDNNFIKYVDGSYKLSIKFTDFYKKGEAFHYPFGEPNTNDTLNNLNDWWYKKFLKMHTSKKLVCTNPDLTVHRGEKEEFCAGYIAKIFEELGGKVIYYGKPYKEIYKMCFEKNEKVLAIGDNLRTDIKGANNINIDCVFISEGVHRDEYKDTSGLIKLLEKYKVRANFFQTELKW